MKITLLCENQVCHMDWLAEWGFAAFIEYQDKTILFDTGFSDVYWRNADKAKIDLEQVDFIALSHFHRDHTRGLLFNRFQQKKKVVLHPRILTARLNDSGETIDKEYAQIQAKLKGNFDLLLSDKTFQFCEGAFFLGEIPRITEFEAGEYEGDSMPDDTALAFQTDKGAVVVSGCSHAGICNICEYAKEVTSQNLYAVLGGFHLLEEENPPVDQTIDYFKQEQPAVLAPMHCVEFEYMTKFHNEFGITKYSAGSVIEL